MTKSTSTFTAIAADPARELAGIMARAANPGLIAACFHGENRFYATLDAIRAIDRKAGPAGPRLFRRIPGETGPEAMRRLVTLTAQAERGRPSLPAYAIAWLDALGIDRRRQDAQILILAAANAEMVQGHPPAGTATAASEPPYHNRSHFLQAFQFYNYCIETQRELQTARPDVRDILLQVRLTDGAIVTGQTAMISHDNRHTGTGNPRDATGKPVRFYNEDIAVDSITPIIYALHDPAEADRQLRTIRTHIRFTDPGEPRCVELYGALDRVRDGGKPALSPDYDPPDSPAFWATAAMISDADIATSAAGGAHYNHLAGKRLTEEAQRAHVAIDFTTVASQKFFQNTIVGKDGFQSGPGRLLFNTCCFKQRRELDRKISPHDRLTEDGSGNRLTDRKSPG